MSKGGQVMSRISIEGLDKAAVLAALYNRAKPWRKGFLRYDPTSMTVEEAQQIISGRGDDLAADLGVRFVRTRGLIDRLRGFINRLRGKETTDTYQYLRYDYLNGRVMKVDLEGDELETSQYNTYNGEGAAETVIEQLRQTGEVDSAKSRALHRALTRESAEDARRYLTEPPTVKKTGDRAVITIGLDEHTREELVEAIEKVRE